MELYLGIRVIQMEPYEEKEFYKSDKFHHAVLALARTMLEHSPYYEVSGLDVQICRMSTFTDLGVIGYFTVERGLRKERHASPDGAEER